MSNTEALRDIRWQPTGFTEHQYPDIDAVIYQSVDGRPRAMGYIGKATKPKFHYSFANLQRRDEFIAEWLETQQRQKEQKNIAAAKLAEFKKTFVNPYKIGDILYNSWGWEQTNIDYYQVIEIKPRSLIVREIDDEKVYSHSMAGTTTPLRDAFIGEPRRINISIKAGYNDGDPYVGLKCEHGYLGLWEGKPNYFSQYA